MTVPSPARVYDYLLGGKDNYPVDRAVTDQLLALAPDSRVAARANRGFLRRAVRYVAAEAGIEQFIDLGTGLPTSPSVHEIARQSNPAARVVYVDNDPLVKAHNDAKLATDPHLVTLRADIRQPAAILDAPQVTDLIDFSRPVAVLLVAVLHFVADADDPAAIIGHLHSRMAPGSHLILSHTSTRSDPEPVKQLTAAAAGTPLQATLRSPEQILHLMSGFEVLPPGLVPVQQWRPDMDAPTTRLDVQAAVARKN